MEINLNNEPEPEFEIVSPELEREDDRIIPTLLGRRRSRRQRDEINQMEGSTSSAGPMHVDHQQHPQTLHQQHTSQNLQGSSCQRIKWTDETTNLLIKLVYYAGEERKSVILLKGKWKAVSQVMSDKGFSVTPKQCEDKFHELNKRYRRLIDLLGWDDACKVVEDHAVMKTMDISLKAKADVWKSLKSKHLFFEEMTSYYNGHLPSDPELRKSLQRALRSDDDHDTRNVLEDVNEDDSWTLDKHAQHTSDSVRDRVPLAICGPILSGKSPPPDFPAEPYQFLVVNADQTTNQRLLDAAIREKELADMASLRVQLQREQERARGLETQLADAKAEQGRVKSLEEEIVQLKNNEAQLNAKITNAEAATTELARLLAKVKEEYRTELAAKIKEGVKEFIDNIRREL
ncbi:uncharacterized protein LOC113280989 isoform X1 [Papaver somniferum]|nr:uncharacterized protein LOC113280961 isoform X1 [Papaver somniferum]XP_026385403.1 uncharacterized protein LOC113280989 isoform X1 [Papaver somniferum]